MVKSFVGSLVHHGRFYASALCGVLAYAGARAAGISTPALAGGDAFYAIFLMLSVAMIVGQTPQTLQKRAANEDEGIVVVFLITIGTMGFFCLAAFEALSKKHGVDLVALAMAGGGALLGWFVLHTVMAFYYADLHYFDDPETHADDMRDLEFPGCVLAGPWDFLYFSFVVGMTAQVSDVQVKTTAMRKAVMAHGVASFFFNTVFIAMAVNAAVSLAA
jgi:uncharacterized membrane protein